MTQIALKAEIEAAIERLKIRALTIIDNNPDMTNVQNINIMMQLGFNNRKQDYEMSEKIEAK